MRRRVTLALQTLAIFFSLWMVATRGHASDSIEVAVLKNRADSIEHHLENTDSTVSKLAEQVDGPSKDMSEMHGEERVAWSVITLLCGGSIVVQFRKKDS